MSPSATMPPIGLILGTLTAALVLSILPLPDWAAVYRPQWAALTLVFWSLTLPRQIGVFWAFGTGLVLDVASGSVLGAHALSLSVVAFLALELSARIVAFPHWQQAVSVWLLLLVERLLSLWIMAATGHPTPTLAFWLPTLVGALLWPLLSALLRQLAHLD